MHGQCILTCNIDIEGGTDTDKHQQWYSVHHPVLAMDMRNAADLSVVVVSVAMTEWRALYNFECLLLFTFGLMPIVLAKEYPVCLKIYASLGIAWKRVVCFVNV